MDPSGYFLEFGAGSFGITEMWGGVHALAPTAEAILTGGLTELQHAAGGIKACLLENVADLHLEAAAVASSLAGRATALHHAVLAAAPMPPPMGPPPHGPPPHGGPPPMPPAQSWRSFLLTTIWILPLIPLLLRLALPTVRRDQPWNTKIDLSLALGCGLLMAPLSAFWLTRYYLEGDPVMAADFQQYCLLVDTLRQGQMPTLHYERSMAPAWWAGIFARRFGIMDGLTLSSILSIGMVSSSLYLWARALYSRVAGLAAAILLGSVVPLVIMTHSLSFYPIWTATFAFGAATTALALRYRTLPAIFSAGVGLGLILLIDVRGLVWAVPLFGTSLLALLPLGSRGLLLRSGAAKGIPRRPGAANGRILRVIALTIPLRAIALAIPLIFSFFAAQRLYLPTTPTLDVQIRRFEEDAKRNAGLPNTFVRDKRFSEGGFLWGHSSPLAVVQTLRDLWEISREPNTTAQTVETLRSRKRYVDPWTGLLLAALAVATLGLIREPLRLLAFYGTIAPFGISLWKSAMVWPHMRMLGTVSPIIPLALGLAFATLLQAGPHPLKRWIWKEAEPLAKDDEMDGPGTEEAKRAGGGPARASLLNAILAPTMVAALLLMVVNGVIPTYLSVAAAWRVPYRAGGTIQQTFQYLGGRSSYAPEEFRQCAEALQRDVEAGHTATGRIYPWR